MKSYGLVVLAAAGVAVEVVLVAGCGGGSSHASAASPACLPATLNHSAALAGTTVDVSPAPETGSANPRTQISFLGTPVADIRDVSVVGSHSGNHDGQLRGYSQGDGASFVPAQPFDSGERVSVHAVIGAGSAGKPVAFSFAVDTPYPIANTPPFPASPAAPSDYQSFATLPGVEAPILTVTVPDHDPGAGDILTTNGPGVGQNGTLIYTPQGRLVWFYEVSGSEAAEDLNEQTYEGRRDLTWWKGRVLELGFGQGEDLVMNSSYQTVARVAGGNGLAADLHDFQLVPHDIAYITAYNPIRCNLTSVKGVQDGAIEDAAVQEIDMKTGLVRWEWHSLDHIGAAESEVETPHGSSPWDYLHLNSIDPEPGGDVFISGRSTWAGYQLQAGTGRVLWRLGGNSSSFKMGPGTSTAWQHDGRILGNGQVTFFDDGANPPIHQQSRAIRIALNLKTHEARLVASLTHPDPPLLAASQGNAQTLGNGNTVVGYGGVPAISEFSPGGSLLFDSHQPYDTSFYRAFRFPWSGQPLSPPAVLADLDETGEETIVRASWNGATDVASWRVLAGNGSGALAAQTVFPASGFESSAILTQKFTRVAVQALNSAGHVLGTSQTTAVTSFAASLPSSRPAG